MFNRLKNNRPSAALVIAVIALFASLGGASYAAVSVTGKDVKNSSLTGKDVKNSSLTGKDVKNGSLAGADVKGDSLGGNEILESQLGKVPAATTADQAGTAGSASSADNANAVGGVTVRSINYRVPSPSPATEFFSAGGLKLTGSCAGSVLTVNAATTTDDAQIDSYSVDPGVAPPPPVHNPVSDTNFDIADSVNLVADDEDREVGELRYARADGGIVDITWHAHDAGTSCAFSGVAMVF